MTVPGGSLQTAACLGSEFCITVDGFPIRMAGLNPVGSTDPGASQASTEQQTDRDRSTAEVLKTAPTGKAPQAGYNASPELAGSASSSTPTGSTQRTPRLTTNSKRWDWRDGSVV